MNEYTLLICQDGEHIIETVYADSLKEAKEAIKAEIGKCRIYIY